MRKILGCKRGYANLVPIVLAVIIAFAILYVGLFINGAVHQNLEDSYPIATNRNIQQNKSLSRMNNISINQESAVDIVNVVIIITILASAIAAIFLFTRFR